MFLRHFTIELNAMVQVKMFARWPTWRRCRTRPHFVWKRSVTVIREVRIDVVKGQKGTFAKASSIHTLLLAATIIVTVAIAKFFANAFELLHALCSVKIVAHLV